MLLISHIFSNKNDFEAVFRPPSFVIPYVTPAFNLNTLLKNRGSFRELRTVVVGRCIYIVTYILFNFVASKEY